MFQLKGVRKKSYGHIPQEDEKLQQFAIACKMHTAFALNFAVISIVYHEQSEIWQFYNEFYIISDMAYHVNDTFTHTKLPPTKTGGIWTRKRLVRNAQGVWV